MPDWNPIIFILCFPTKQSAINPVENGINNPAPHPNRQLMIINSIIDFANKYAAAEATNKIRAIMIVVLLWWERESFPDKSTNGIINRLGRTVRSCFSICVVFGKMFDSVDSIGVTANPGKFTISDKERIAASVIAVIGVLPVLIFIALIFIGECIKCSMHSPD